MDEYGSYQSDEWYDDDPDDYEDWDEDDLEEYQYDEQLLTLWERIDQWVSHTRIGRLYRRWRQAIRDRYNDLNNLPF